jgi:integrase
LTNETEKEERQSLILQGNAYDNFINAIQTKATKRLYTIAVRKFMEFQKVENPNDLLPTNNVTGASLVQSRVMEWIKHLKEVEKLGPSSCKSYVPAILLFYDMNDVTLNKRKISKTLPHDRKINNDRPYTREEIAKLLNFCGPRERALILLLASTGMRIGAVPELQLQHLHKIERYGLYKITVYEGDKHEYYFTTPEAAQAIDAYLDYRKRYGEKISSEETPQTPLIREEFDINDQLIARHPRKMSPEGLVDIITLKLERSGIVPLTPLKEGQKRGQKRNHIARSHGFRKFVITTMINKRINETIRNLLTDHSVKLDKNYYGKTEEDMLSEYVIVDDLTINDENRLRRENEMLKVKKSEYEGLKEDLENYKKSQAEELKRVIVEFHKKTGNSNPQDFITDEIERYKSWSTDESIQSIEESDRRNKELAEEQKKLGWRWDSDNHHFVHIKTGEIVSGAASSWLYAWIDKRRRNLEEYARLGWRWDNDKDCFIDMKTGEIIKESQTTCVSCGTPRERNNMVDWHYDSAQLESGEYFYSAKCTKCYDNQQKNITQIREKALAPNRTTEELIDGAICSNAIQVLRTGKKVNCFGCGTPYDYETDWHYVRGGGSSFLVECGKCYSNNKKRNNYNKVRNF